MSSVDLKRSIPHNEAFQGAWYAIIAETASGEFDPVKVTIPDFHPHQRWGPCKWQPRGVDYPTRGDEALVMYDNRRHLWIVTWWPT